MIYKSLIPSRYFGSDGTAKHVIEIDLQNTFIFQSERLSHRIKLPQKLSIYFLD